MHIEIHVAINYVMSQLYEKLPRRRVNIFGEELEKALKEKFEGHWYPDAPEKGSGYRCLKVGRAIDPPDPLLEKAAYDSGLDVQDILEHLPKELNVWIDPGEVSFRIGDKGTTEILYSTEIPENSDNEVARTFNPEAKCFRPNDFSTTTFNPLVIAKPGSPTSGSLSPVSSIKCCSPPSQIKPTNYKNGKAITPNNSMHCFVQRTNTPTFTTATFAQTKFGSTKLKTNAKRTNRMSPTEFANYIKQRAQMQQQMQLQQHGQQPNTTISPPQIRSFGDVNYYAPQNNYSFRNSPMDGAFTAMDSLNRFSTFMDDGSSQFFNQNMGPLSPISTNGGLQNSAKDSQDKNYLENLNFTLNSPGPSSPYPHLLLAN